jgi:hypothetical protein
MTRGAEGTLGAAPTDYEVPLETKRFRFDAVHASFSKDPPRQQGTLSVEILVNDEVVQEQETSAEVGHVSVHYSPQTDR